MNLLFFLSRLSPAAWHFWSRVIFISTTDCREMWCRPFHSLGERWLTAFKSIFFTGYRWHFQFSLCLVRISTYCQISWWKHWQWLIYTERKSSNLHFRKTTAKCWERNKPVFLPVVLRGVDLARLPLLLFPPIRVAKKPEGFNQTADLGHRT